MTLIDFVSAKSFARWKKLLKKMVLMIYLDTAASSHLMNNLHDSSRLCSFWNLSKVQKKNDPNRFEDQRHLCACPISTARHEPCQAK